MRSSDLPVEVTEWVEIVRNEVYRTSEDQKHLVDHILSCFDNEDIYIDTEQLGHYMDVCSKYVPFGLFPWQKFVIALHDCTYWANSGLPRWPDLFCVIGRGAGKDGTIAVEALILTSPYNGIREYDVDICANNEEQAVRPVQDLTGFFEQPSIEKKVKKFYHWTKERITSLKTRSIIKGRTNSPKGKDGLRSGIVVFNEIHQYPNYDNINVFTTGLGKKKHPRRSYFTTNGDVRDGPLDDLLEDSTGILRNGQPDNGLLPFICRLDSRDEVHDEKNWPKANPSLPYLPSLLDEIRKEYREWKNNPARLPAFMSKRMNLPESAKESAVADWELIAATNKPLPELKGRSCTVGIDYSKLNDWAAVNIHFRTDEQRYDINHAWVCTSSADIPRIKAPWREWAKKGDITIVDDVEIHPSYIVDFVSRAAQVFIVEMVALDSYRYALLADALSRAGFSKERKNLMLVKQTDILKVVPVIDHCFRRNLFTWGDVPHLRWATNNTKVIPYGKDQGADKGSFVYAKIEGKSRKTDPFMALVASMVPESRIKERPKLSRVGVITF